MKNLKKEKKAEVEVEAETQKKKKGKGKDRNPRGPELIVWKKNQGKGMDLFKTNFQNNNCKIM